MKWKVAILLLPLFVACSKGTTEGIAETKQFFRCLKLRDFQCLWNLSGSRTHKTFEDLAKRLTKAWELCNTKIPENFRERYCKALLLDHFRGPVSAKPLFNYLLDAKGMDLPEGITERLSAEQTSTGFIVTIGKRTSIEWVRTKRGLRTDILGDTFVSLPLYSTLIHNLKVLEEDAKLFSAHSRNSPQLPQKFQAR